MTVVIRGDALRLPIADESVDLIVTSPPYFALRSYRDAGDHLDGQVGSEETPQDFLEALWSATAEMMRVLKPTGSLWVNLGDKYVGSGGHNNSTLAGASRSSGSTLDGPQYSHRMAKERAKKVGGGGADRRAEQRETVRRNAPIQYNKATIGGARPKSLMGLPWRYALGCIDELGLILRAEVLWSKPNGLPESVKDRVRRSHEQLFHFTKEPKYFASTEEVREPPVYPLRSQTHNERAGASLRDGSTLEGTGMRPHTFDMDQSVHPAGRLPGSVWTIATEPLRVPEALEIDHYAAFPTELPRRIILGWSPAGGVVLDPFGGTGTTAMVARALGRVGVSLDLSSDYCRLARWRIFESGHGRKALARTNGERQEVLL